MAVNEHDRDSVPPEHEPSAPPPADAPATAEGTEAEVPASQGNGVPAPLWVVPLYVGGLILLFLGQRVLEPQPTAQTVVTLLGVASVLGATVARFLPKYRVGGERRDIEKLLGVVSVTGAVAVALYFVSSDAGWQMVGPKSLSLDTEERVRGILTISWTALVLLSLLPMLFAEAALLPMRHAERPEARRVRAAIVSGITLGMAAIYGALFVYSAGRFDVKVDYSYFKTAGPSESTRKIAESLDEPIDVVAFFPEVNEIKAEVQGYLSELSKGVPNLRVEVQDRLLVPKRAKELRATQDGVIVLAKGAVTESLSIGTDPRNAKPKLKTLDRDFQEKLLKLVRSRRMAYLTVGHGELNDPGQADEGKRAVRILRTILQKQNYLIKDLGLAQGLASDVPEDADIVFVLGPTEQFSPEEVASLKRFGDRGGRLFIALDPDAVQWAEPAPGSEPSAEGEESGEDAPSDSAAPPASAAPTPSAKPMPSAAPASSAAPPSSAAPEPAPPPAPGGLDALARAVGVEFSPVELANERQHVRRRFNDSDRTLLVTNRFSSHAAVSTLSRNSARAAVVFFGAGSLERAPGATGKVDFSVRSVPGTFPDANKNYRPDKDEKQSTYNLAAAVSHPRTAEPLKKKPTVQTKKDKDDEKKDDKDSDEMRAFVLADADALTDVVLANVVGNQILFADAVRWLGGEESFSGEVNNEEDVRIEHTKQKDLVWFYATIFGAPALILGLGLVLSRRGRRAGGKR
jgi:hypothetical protein